MNKTQYKEKRIKDLGKEYGKQTTPKRMWDNCISMECGDFPKFKFITSTEITLKMLLECKYTKSEIVEKLKAKFPGKINSSRPKDIFYGFSGGKCKNIEGYRKGNIIGLKWDRNKFFSKDGEWKQTINEQIENLITFEEFTENQEKELFESKSISSEERLKRLKKANKKPDVINVLTKLYKRNQDVIVTVLERANGICEQCNQIAPFLRSVDSTPYLEVHHKLPLSKGGEDTIENAIALCPNCHRKNHYGLL